MANVKRGIRSVRTTVIVACACRRGQAVARTGARMETERIGVARHVGGEGPRPGHSRRSSRGHRGHGAARAELEGHERVQCAPRPGGQGELLPLRRSARFDATRATTRCERKLEGGATRCVRMMEDTQQAPSGGTPHQTATSNDAESPIFATKRGPPSPQRSRPMAPSYVGYFRFIPGARRTSSFHPARSLSRVVIGRWTRSGTSSEGAGRCGGRMASRW